MIRGSVRFQLFPTGPGDHGRTFVGDVGHSKAATVVANHRAPKSAFAASLPIVFW
jgi:hypothetical protein